jgi:multiple sugar transport system permease protein
MKKKKARFTLNKEIYGWLFAAPWIIGLLVFYVYPLSSSFVSSFMSNEGLNPGEFIGFENYKYLFENPDFWLSIKNTIVFTAMNVPLAIVFGVVLAILLNMKLKLQSVYRTILFIPTLVPIVAVSITFMWLFNSQFGLLNYLLGAIGIDGPAWFGSVVWAKPSLMMIAQWGIGGSVLIYIAGLQDIPQSLYEAATIDGAGPLRKFASITIPLLTPVILFNLIMGIIDTLQTFTLPFVISGGYGAPAGSLLFFSMVLYKKAFGLFELGRANAMAWMLFIVIMALTAVVLRSSKKWVYYMGE